MKGKIIYTIVLFSVFLQTFILNGQNKVTIVLSDAETANPLPICNIMITNTNKEQLLVTDSYGKAEYNFELKAHITIQVSHINYETYQSSLKIENDTILNISLNPKKVRIGDVDVYSKRIRRDGMNIHYFSPKEAALDVSLIGEKDVLRHIQNLPGIAQGMEGSLGMFVRGGNTSNNRVEIDGVPVYANTHLFGLFSIFQAEVIQNVAFKMGGISSEDGNFLSSITYVESKNSFVNKPQKSISISPYLLGGSLSTPLKKEKLSLLIGARYSLLKAEYEALKSIGNSDGDINPQVMDGFAKVSWKIDSLNTIHFELLGTNDYLKYTNESEITQNWYNTIALVNWNKRNRNNSRWHTTLYYNHSYNIQKQKTYEEEELTNGLMLQSGINESALKTVYYSNPNRFEYYAGASLQYSQFSPGSEKLIVAQNKEESSNENLSSVLFSSFLGATYQFSDDFSINAGMKVYLYSSDHYSKIRLDPRILANYHFNEYCGLEFSYDHFSQLYHELEGLPTGWSLNMMVPADQNLPIEKCDQIYLGLFKILGKYHFNMGGYYKQMNHLASYISNENLFGVHDVTWQDDIDTGTGESYGLESYVRYRSQRYNWSLAYTLSKTNRQFPNINSGETYPFKFDRRHILNAQIDYLTVQKEEKSQKVFLSFVYSSGHRATIQTGNYAGITPPYWSQREGGVYVPSEMNNQAYNRQLMSSKNGYHMPNYIRLDAGYTFHKQKEKYSREFTISVFNVLNRQNPYLYYYKDDNWYQMSMFSIIPSLRWSILF